MSVLCTFFWSELDSNFESATYCGPSRGPILSFSFPICKLGDITLSLRGHED